MPRSPQPPPPPDDNTNELHVVDYNRTFLKPIIDQLSEGDTCTIQITGTVVNTNEVDTGDGGYMCELMMEPTDGRIVSSGKGGGGGTMASQMKQDQQKRAGQEETDTEEPY
jgi:hypothetical protein